MNERFALLTFRNQSQLLNRMANHTQSPAGTQIRTSSQVTCAVTCTHSDSCGSGSYKSRTDVPSTNWLIATTEIILIKCTEASRFTPRSTSNAKCWSELFSSNLWYLHCLWQSCKTTCTLKAPCAARQVVLVYHIYTANLCTNYTELLITHILRFILK